MSMPRPPSSRAPGEDGTPSSPWSWTFRDGNLIRLDVLGTGADFAQALEAAGLG